MVKKLLSYSSIFVLLIVFPRQMSAQYVLNGDATQSGNCFTLTPNVTWKSGSVWYLDKVDIGEGFEIYYDIFLGCTDAMGADGIAFVLQQVSTSVGSQGEGIGYQGIAPSLAVEFDTHQNFNRSDPANDHLAIMRDGIVNHSTPNNLAGPTSILATSQNAEDCQWHELKITWDADQMSLKVFVDCNLRLNYQADIINDIFNGDSEAFWGFTSATGGLANTHQFCLDYISFVEKLKDTAICKGESVQLSVGSGDQFTWTPATGLNSDTAQNPIAAPDTTTTYFVEVLNNCGNPRYDTITIYVQDSLDKVFRDDYKLCPDGEVLVIPDYPFADFQWDNGQTGDSLLVTQAGTYTAQITNECATFSDTFTVLPPSFPNLITDDVNCQGGNSGQASLNLDARASANFVWYNASGVPLLTFALGQTDYNLNNLPVGTYSYEVFDSTGCFLTDTFFIDEPPSLQLSLDNAVDIECGGDSSGEIRIQASGGTSPYEFSIDGNNFQSSNLFDGLAAGSYTLYVRDSNDCEESLQISLSENPPLQPSILQRSDNLCFGDSLGVVEFSTSGGLPPYEYSLDQQTYQLSNGFNGLAARNYRVYVRDSMGCEASLFFGIQQPPQLQPEVSGQRDIDCFGNSTGAAEISVSGGTGSYSFNFDGMGFSSQNNFSGLPAGDYPFVVRDSNLCLAYDTLTLSEPTPLDGLVDQVIDVACFGDSSGAVFLNGQGGSQPYTFGLNPVSLSTDNQIRGLSEGRYIFTVMDDSSCVDTVSAQINQPSPLSISVVDRQDVDCQGNQSGVLEGLGAGGSPPYQYAITNSGNVGSAFGASPVFDSLFAGIYTLEVLDDNGCTTTVDTFISTPTTLSGGIDTLIDVACFGDSTGSILMTAFGGTGPYEYSFDGVNFAPGPLFDGLPILRDTVILRDANNCIIPIPFQIRQPDSLIASVLFERDIDCFGGNSGEISLGVSGGAFPYTYEMNAQAVQGDSAFPQLNAGTYGFVISDANGCTAQTSTSLSEPDSLELMVDSLRPVACFGENNGYLQFSGRGGAGNYTLSFADSNFSSQFSYDSLGAGIYEVAIQDDSACVTRQPIEISQPDTLMLEVAGKTDILCHGAQTGEVFLNAEGGNDLYTFFIDGGNPQDTSRFDSLFAGAYTFAVEDEKGCRDTSSAFLSEPTPLTLELVEQNQVDCFGNGNGELIVEAGGGTPEYVFLLNNGMGRAEPQFDSLAPGNYEVRVMDGNGCEIPLDSLAITEPDSLIGELRVNDVLCFGEESGSLASEVSGGTQPYAYFWRESPMSEGPNLEGIAAGDYLLEVTDANDCQDLASAVVNQPDTLILSLDSLQEAYCDLANGYAGVSAQGGTEPYNFVWTGSATYEGPIQLNIEGGNFLVEVNDQNGCLDTLVVDVPFDPPATPFFISDPPIDQPLLLSEAQNIDFVNQSENAVSYFWDFGTANGLFDSEDVTFGFDEAGTYVISLTAYNKYFVCPEVYSQTLEIIPDGRLLIANAFTPNGDGVNDDFFLTGEGVVSLTFIIFDQWGREIDRFDDLTDSWNGKNAQGRAMPEGVYAYRVRAVFNSGDELDRAGTISLLR